MESSETKKGFKKLFYAFNYTIKIIINTSVTNQCI